MRKNISKWVAMAIAAAMIVTMVPAESTFAEEMEALVQAEETVIAEEITAEEAISEEIVTDEAMMEETAVSEAVEIDEETETEEAVAGESAQNPKELIAGQKVTLSNYSGTYYMKFTAPENMIVMVTVTDSNWFSLAVEYPDGEKTCMQPSNDQNEVDISSLTLKKGEALKLQISPYSNPLNSKILVDYYGQSEQKNFSLENGTSGVVVYHGNWLDKYIEVYRRESSSQPWAYIGRTTSNGDPEVFVDKNAVSGKLYAYTTRMYDRMAFDSEGIRYYLSSKDEKGQGIRYLSTPTLTVTNTAAGAVLKWKKVEGAQGYVIARGKYGKKYDSVEECYYDTVTYDLKQTITNASTVTYTDKTAVSGGRYEYTINAYYGKYESCEVCKENVYLSSITPTISNVAAGIYVKWPAVTGATAYRVYRKYGTGAYKLLTTTTATTYGDKAVNTYNGYAYTYAVRAIKAYDGVTYAGAFTPKTLVRLTKVTLAGASRTKAVYLKWTKNAKATGYQIQYSTASNFTGGKIAVAKGASTLTKTIGSLYSNKTYYIRIRAYKTVSGVNHYGAWSNTVAVKTK